MKKILIILSTLVVLAPACGFTPQTIVLKPEKQPAPSSTVPGRTVYLTVVDVRPNQALGTGTSGTMIPGGVKLMVSGDLTDTVRTSIAKGLQQQGFVVTSRKTADVHELRVEIRNLNYFLFNREPGHAYVSAECKLVATCIKGSVPGSVRPHERYYRGEDMKSRFLMPFMPGKEANERHINNAISKAVNSLLQDSELIHCLMQ